MIYLGFAENPAQFRQGINFKMMNEMSVQVCSLGNKVVKLLFFLFKLSNYNDAIIRKSFYSQNLGFPEDYAR